jgi:hypothetical protein
MFFRLKPFILKPGRPASLFPAEEGVGVLRIPALFSPTSLSPAAFFDSRRKTPFSRILIEFPSPGGFSPGQRPSAARRRRRRRAVSVSGTLYPVRGVTRRVVLIIDNFI